MRARILIVSALTIAAVLGTGGAALAADSGADSHNCGTVQAVCTDQVVGVGPVTVLDASGFGLHFGA